MPDRAYRGILFIGDPHLSAATLGFRRDNYPLVILRKLKWCLDYAQEEWLLPAILGDLFEFPRDNANWLLGELFFLLERREIVAIYGNHDVHENLIGDDDSLSVLHKGGALRLLNNRDPWRGVINGRQVVLGGTAWGQWLPEKFECDEPAPLVIWMAHHDVKVPGYEEQGRFAAKEIPGVHLVVNGHIHRRLAEHRVGGTLWVTPGNISRIKRSDISRQHVPSVLRVNVERETWRHEWVVVPHARFEDVFHPGVETEDPSIAGGSAFVQGLAELESRLTETGAGLTEFLEKNVGQFEPAVAREILVLAQEINTHAT